MELKEMAGSSDLFDAMKRLEKQKKKADKKREDDATRDKLRSSNKPPNVFDFINRRLHGKRGNCRSLHSPLLYFLLRSCVAGTELLIKTSCP